MAQLPIPFGNPMTYPGHSGVDFPQPAGTPFRASGSGVVTWLGSNSRGGYFIWVKYDAIGPKVGYHHMPSHAACPREGTRFNEGDQLGVVGSTGNSTGPHLHSEVEGYATTAGYWTFFDSSRVVGGSGGSGFKWNWTNRSTVEIQTMVGANPDGIYGPETDAKIRALQAWWGLEVDGQWGVKTDTLAFFVADGDWGEATTRRVQYAFGVTRDGEMGPETWSAIQRHLGVTVDGEQGPQTIKSLQRALGVTADGEIGPATVSALQAWLLTGGWLAPVPDPADSELQVDGELGPHTIRRMQVAFGVEPDGEWGPDTTSAIQRHLGVTVDGDLGPVTIKALQRALGVTADGELGPETITALQTYLVNGGYLQPVPSPEDTAPPKPEATPRTPVYPAAIRGWNVPLSSDRPAGQVVDTLVVHHQASTNDDEDYFKSQNSRSSCPTWQVKSDGTVVELIAPDKKPSSTGSWNARSWAIETQNTSREPNWGISEASHESIAQIAAWLHETRGLVLDREHVLGHNETGAATACPGPSMNLDEIVVRAKEIVAVNPEPDPDTVEVDRNWLQSLFDKLKNLLS